MSLCADGVPVELWQIAWNAVGPFTVDTWDSSHKREDGTRIPFHRVVGKHGFQCSIPAQDGELRMASGAVIMQSREYAQAVCDAANAGQLRRQEEPKWQHRSKRA